MNHISSLWAYMMRPHLFTLLSFSHFIFSLSGQNVLYDLNIDPYESKEQDPATSNYSDIYNELLNRTSYWADFVIRLDKPLGTYKNDTWKKNQGITSWLENDENYTSPIIPVKYSYSDAPNIIFVLVDDWVSI